MRITIIPVDGAVYVDGYSYSNLDLSGCGIPNEIHALQWYDTYGEVEFNSSFDGENIIKPSNQIIRELPDWVNAAKSKWDEAKIAEEDAAAKTKEAAKNQPATTGTQTL